MIDRFALPIACALLAALFLSLLAGVGQERFVAPAASSSNEMLADDSSPKLIDGCVLKERFANAPVEWRPAGSAIVEVTNRWQCDPRWTFLGLSNDRTKGKSAVLWNKRFFPGDVAVEFYVGVKMDHLRVKPGSSYYSYARDINLTIGSDGADLRKGYTFSFGGFKHSCSAMLRDGVELKRVPITIPTSMDYHLHWFVFRAERKSGRLVFQVDRLFKTWGDKGSSDELSVDDPTPCSGNRIAIWTYDSAIVLAKVRVSGEGGFETESPDFVAGPLKTIYDP